MTGTLEIDGVCHASIPPVVDATTWGNDSLVLFRSETETKTQLELLGPSGERRAVPLPPGAIETVQTIDGKVFAGGSIEEPLRYFIQDGGEDLPPLRNMATGAQVDVKPPLPFTTVATGPRELMARFPAIWQSDDLESWTLTGSRGLASDGTGGSVRAINAGGRVLIDGFGDPQSADSGLIVGGLLTSGVSGWIVNGQAGPIWPEFRHGAIGRAARIGDEILFDNLGAGGTHLASSEGWSFPTDGKSFLGVADMGSGEQMPILEDENGRRFRFQLPDKSLVVEATEPSASAVRSNSLQAIEQVDLSLSDVFLPLDDGIRLLAPELDQAPAS